MDESRFDGFLSTFQAKSQPNVNLPAAEQGIRMTGHDADLNLIAQSACVAVRSWFFVHLQWGNDAWENPARPDANPMGTLDHKRSL